MIDLASFSATVENIFYCSFLVRDGFASITLEPNGGNSGFPAIKPIAQAKKKKNQERKKKKMHKWLSKLLGIYGQKQLKLSICLSA